MNIKKYMELLVHRRDVFAQQQSNGSYLPIRSPITEDEVLEHLEGFASYGVYCIRPEDQTVKYVVFDLDTLDEEAESHLYDCCSRLALSLHLDDPDARLGLLFEHSGSKGSHMWLFFDEPLPAAQVRAWVMDKFWPIWASDFNPGWPLEIFPKQDRVEPGGFGNLVKLPFGVHQKTGNRSLPVFVQGWAESVDQVVPLPARLVPVVESSEGAHGPAAHGRPQSGSHRRLGAPSAPFPCIDKILHDGAPEGCRTLAMFQLALYWYGHGLDRDLAVEACLAANEQFDPPLREREVRDHVRSAYTGRYEGATCGTDWLRDFCPGPCKSGWHVNQTKAGGVRFANPGDEVTLDVVDRKLADGRVRIRVAHPDVENTPTLVVKEKGN